MLRRCKSRIVRYLPCERTSHINPVTLTFKDPELTKKFVEQDRLICVGRAKCYFIWNLFMLVLSPVFLPDNKANMYMHASFSVITLVVVIGCLAAAHFRLAAIELILPLGVTLRGIGQLLLKPYF